MSNQITTIDSPVSNSVAGTAATIFSPEGLNQLMKFAEVMAQSRVTVPAHLAGKPADCMAVAMQAAQWGMNPFAVAQKTHVVSGTLGYEAQLVNAVITTMSPTKDRINYEWFGPWEQVIGKFVEKTSQKGNAYIAPAWTLKDEAGCGVKVWATMKGEENPRVLELLLSQAQVRNSTLWASDPKQQLAYLAVKRWSRLHCPDVIMGVYTPDELAEMPRVERDVTPPATSAAGLNSLINSKPAEKEIKTVNQDERSPDDLLAAFTEAATKAASVEELDKAYKYGAHVLSSHEEHLQLATDVYKVRRDELNEVPM
ncbi:RecT family recombinase [Serratia liquefaciens]|uniref:RecT family recombinase n=1 Tax=Serratia liquefaciens TaxID=614 RepID=UPI001F2A1347|nr:RecT family recombinase [Serratia liquefaciens]MCE9939756.1 recombinase RecT [Serratia liquefaciens]